MDRHKLLFAALTCGGALGEVGPSALFARLANTSITTPGLTIGGQPASYQIFPYANATQFSGGAEFFLGQFTTFVSNATTGLYIYQLYEGGSSLFCYPDVPRSLNVYIACGPNFTVTSVSEPVECVYVLSLTMSEACGIDFVIGNEAASSSASLGSSWTSSGTPTGSPTPSALRSGTPSASVTESSTLSATPSCSASPAISPSASLPPCLPQRKRRHRAWPRVYQAPRPQAHHQTRRAHCLMPPA